MASIVRDFEDLTPLEKLCIVDMSYSRLDTFQSCKAKYFYSYITKEARTSGEAAITGTAVHSVLEKTDLNDMDIDAMIELLEEEFKAEDPDGIVGDTLKGVADTILHEFVDRHEGETFYTIEDGDEYGFEVVLGNGLYRGYIDRIDFTPDGGILITDYKAQPLWTPILTPNGWSTIGEVAVGDEVIGVDGKPTEVVGVYPQGIVPSYRVDFTDGSFTYCSEEHLWEVESIGWTTGPRVLPLKELGNLKCGSNNRYKTPTVAPVEFNDQSPLPVDPYVLGVILGDGGTTSGRIKIHAEDQEILLRVEERLPEDLTLKYDDIKTTRVASISGRRNPMKQQFDAWGLMGCRSWEKFVPAEYLTASVEDRKELLYGLMDTDGGSSTRNEYRTTSPQLRDAVVELCRSLGGTPTVSHHDSYYYDDDGDKVTGKTCYVVNVRVPFNPYRLSRKVREWKAPRYSLDRRITAVTRTVDTEMQCIRVDNEDGLYVTDNYIVTHNTGKHQVAQKHVHKNLQLGIYAIVARHKFPDRWPIRGELYYLRTGKQIGHTYESHEELDALEREVIKTAVDVLYTDDFVYTKNTFTCKHLCDFGKSGICTRGAKVIRKHNQW